MTPSISGLSVFGELVGQWELARRLATRDPARESLEPHGFPGEEAVRAPRRDGGSTMEKLIETSLLRPGLFVSRLDRPWLETPFLLQGFVVRTQEDIAQLRLHCKRVFIDTERGDDVDELAEDPRGAHRRRPRSRTGRSPGAAPAPASDDRPYPVPLEQEVVPAFDLHRDTRAVVNKVLEDVRLGKSVDAPEVKEIVGDIADSILRNPDAMMFLTQLRAQSQYLELHSINVCIFALVFGRHLGLDRDDLRDLGLGALLHDVGYTQIPEELLSQPGNLTPAQYRIVRSHVAQGERILEQTPGIPGAALELVRNHHERIDGSGYPRALQGNAIGLPGLIGAIVDSYDAMTTDRPWRTGLTPHEALTALYAARGQLYDPQLVAQFIESIGIYPAGSIVELDTGDIAVVIASDPRYRLLPTVRLLVDPQGQRYDFVSMVDLRALQGSASTKPIKIRSAVLPGRYGIGAQDLIAAGLQS
jgi:HD-GYP domain-containing protein (c-di-GMP phosphodiesterase class II)